MTLFNRHPILFLVFFDFFCRSNPRDGIFISLHRRIYSAMREIIKTFMQLNTQSALHPCSVRLQAINGNIIISNVSSSSSGNNNATGACGCVWVAASKAVSAVQWHEICKYKVCVCVYVCMFVCCIFILNIANWGVQYDMLLVVFVSPHIFQIHTTLHMYANFFRHFILKITKNLFAT